MSQSAELSSDESHSAGLQRRQFCLRTCGWFFQRWYFLSEHIWRDMFHLKNSSVLVNKFGLQPPSPARDILPSTSILVSTENLSWIHCFIWPIAVLSLFCTCYSMTNFLHFTVFKHFWECTPSSIELKDSQDISQMACNTAQKQYLTSCLGAKAIGNSDESATLISLQHALTVWQIWKGQIWNRSGSAL